MLHWLTVPAHVTAPVIITTSQSERWEHDTSQSVPQSTRQLLTRAHSTVHPSSQPSSQFDASVQRVKHASPHDPLQLLTDPHSTSQGSSAQM
jgi:hypothetical protein